VCGMKRLVGAVAVIGMLALSGCVPEQVIPTLPPTPTDGPLFASEEEALAAATAAYEAYLAVSGQVSADGGEHPERIEDVAVRDLLASSLEGFETLRKNGWRTTGQSRVARSILQFADLAVSAGPDVVAAYICVDVSDVDVLDSDGRSVVSAERPDLQVFEVSFDANDSGHVIPATRSAWNEVGVCGAA